MAPSKLALALASTLLSFGTGARKSRGQQQQVALSARWQEFQGGGAVPLGRIPAGATTCDGSLFVFGGETDYDSSDPFVVNRYLNDLWMFTPKAGSAADGEWSELSADGDANAPSMRTLSSMVCSSGKIFLWGGHVRIVGQKYTTAADLWSFDIANRQWKLLQNNTALHNGPSPMAGQTGTLVEDKMVIFGGRSPTDGVQNAVWIYDISAGTWRKGSPMFSPAPRHFHIAVHIPGSSKMGIWGGVEDTMLWEYDVNADAWSLALGIAQDFESGRAGAFADGKLWSFGGFRMEGRFPNYNNDLFENSEGYFQEVTIDNSALPEGRCYGSLLTVNNTIWLYGGYRRPAPVERLGDLWRLVVA